MPHPCCGKDLRSATKLAAYLDVVWTSIFIAGAIVIIISSAQSFIVSQQQVTSQPSNNSSSSPTTVLESTTKLGFGGLIVGVIILVVKILQLLMAIYLLQAANERNSHKCKIWIYITCVFVAITVMNFLFDATYLEASQGGTVGSYISIIGILLHFYFLWIVFSFKQELERTRAQPEVDALGMKA